MEPLLRTHDDGDAKNSSPSPTSLHEAIAHAKLEIAKVTGVDPEKIRVLIEV